MALFDLVCGKLEENNGSIVFLLILEKDFSGVYCISTLFEKFDSRDSTKS